MSVLKGFFRSTSRDSSPSSTQTPRKKKDSDSEKNVRPVETIQDDQQFNPYTEIRLLSHHTDIVNHLIVVDQYSIASAGSDGLVVLWGVSDGEVQQVLDGHQQRPITCLNVMQHTTPDKMEYTALVTAASDRQIIIWDVGSGTQLHKLSTPCSTPRCILPIEIEGESTMFCSGGESLHLWSGQCELLDQIRGDEDTKDDIVQLLQIKRTKVIGVIDKALYVYSISGLREEDTKEDDSKATLQFVRKLTAHRETVTSVAKINDTSFASGSMDGCIRLWSCNTPNAPIRELNVVTDYQGEMRSFPLSVQDMMLLQQRFLIAAVGAGLCLYDTITGCLVAHTPGPAHFSKITRLCLTQNGSLLVTCASDGRIRLWGRAACFQCNMDDVMDTKPSQIEKLLGKRCEELKHLERPVCLELLGECVAHAGAVETVVECPAGSLVSCGVDGLVILWKNGIQEKLQKWERLRGILHGSPAT